MLDAGWRRDFATIVEFALHPARSGIYNHMFEFFDGIGFSNDAGKIGYFGGKTAVFVPYSHRIPHFDPLKKPRGERLLALLPDKQLLQFQATLPLNTFQGFYSHILSGMWDCYMPWL